MPNTQSLVATRVGVVLCDLGKLNITALKYLIVHLNTLQTSIEFELLAADPNDPLLTLLGYEQVADRNLCRKMLPEFHDRFLQQICDKQASFDLADRSTPDGLAVISLAQFSDEHYGLTSGNVVVQALGSWDRGMAPPSILEFILTLLMRQSASFVARSVSKSVHLGTKGCLFDFTDDISEARYKALQAFVCGVCRARLADWGSPHFANDLILVLDTKWFGVSSDPSCPAGIVAKLGYDLFLTRGIEPTLWERTRTVLLDVGMKEFVKLIAGVLLAAVIFWLGFDAGKK